MNRLRLFGLLRRNNRLSFQRSPSFEQSLMARIMMVIGGGVMVIYLIAFAIMFSMMANEEDMPGMVFVIMPLLLMIDFLMRFGLQQTPSMLIKPYLLLPVEKNVIIENFLVSSLFSGWTLTWLSLFLPYSIIIWAGGTSFADCLVVLVSGMLLVMTNSQWYLLVRTLVSRSVLWWAMPLVLYAVYFVALFFDDETKAFTAFGDFVGDNGASPFMLVACILFFALAFLINRRIQLRYAIAEMAKEEKKPAGLKHVSRIEFLNRFGMIGEYLKLELKSIMRNKTVKSRVISSLVLISVLSALIAFTPAYDSAGMRNFWCFYCFALYGMTSLIKVMEPEGNYIEFLLVNRENTLTLLKAKYYIHVATLALPFLIMLPAVITGKFSILMMAAYMLVCSGPLYFTLFQLAVYNKQTLPLDQKLTGKNNTENGIQMVVSMSSMLLIPAVALGLIVLTGEDTAFAIMAVVGRVFTLLHPLWLRNIYVRMMRRKHENLEGFISSK